MTQKKSNNLVLNKFRTFFAYFLPFSYPISRLKNCQYFVSYVSITNRNVILEFSLEMSYLGNLINFYFLIIVDAVSSPWMIGWWFVS